MIFARRVPWFFLFLLISVFLIASTFITLRSNFQALQTFPSWGRYVGNAAVHVSTRCCVSILPEISIQTFWYSESMYGYEENLAMLLATQSWRAPPQKSTTCRERERPGRISKKCSRWLGQQLTLAGKWEKNCDCSLVLITLLLQCFYFGGLD